MFVFVFAGRRLQHAGTNETTWHPTKGAHVEGPFLELANLLLFASGRRSAGPRAAAAASQSIDGSGSDAGAQLAIRAANAGTPPQA